MNGTLPFTGKSLWAITGASGYVGRALVAELVRRGERLRGLGRDPEALPPGIERVAGDVRDSVALRALVRGACVVVHLAAFVHRSVRGAAADRECWSVNVEGTQRLIEAVSQEAPEAFVVVISSASVYGSGDEAFDERAACNPRGTYGASKLEADQQLLAAVKAGRIRGAILRPAMVFGPGASGNLVRLIQMVRLRIAIEIDGGRQRKSLVHVETLVEAIIAVARCQSLTSGEIFNVSGGPMTIHEIIDSIAEALRVRPLRVDVPASLARLVQSLARASRIPAAVSLAQTLETYATSAVLSDEKLRAVTGFTPRQRPVDALISAIRASTGGSGASGSAVRRAG